MSADVVISNLAAVLSAAVVFRYLSVSDYGQLTLALSFYASGTVFLDFGLGGVFTSEVAKARGAGNLSWARFLLTQYLWLNAITGSVVLAIFLVFSRQQQDPLWAVMGLYLFTTSLNVVARVLFHSYTRYRRLAAQSVVQSLSRLLLLLTLPIWWRGRALLGVAWTYPLMNVAALAVSAGMALRALQGLKGVRTGGYSLASLTTLFRQQGIYITLSVPVKRIAEQLPVWFLKVLVGDVGVGVYGAAQKGISLFYAFFSALETTIFPLVSEQIEVDRERLQIALRQMQKYSFWLGLVAAVLGSLVAHWLVLIVAGDTYQAAVPLFRLMLWILVVYAFVQSQRPLFYALGQQKWLFVLYLLNVLVYVLVLPFAIVAMGIIGAVFARLSFIALSAGSRMMVLWKLDSQVFLDPLSVLRIEGFDQRLWEALRARVLHWFQGSDAGIIED